MNQLRTLSTLDDFHLDILAQHPRINRLYTQITFCFELRNDSPSLQSETINTLNSAIRRLSASFPWVAGRVVNDNGTFKIKSSQSSLPLVVKDFRNDASSPSWDTFERANFPFCMLDEYAIAPCKTMALSEDSVLDLPVFMIQANFITGGLLLTLNGQHGSMDMAGQSQVVYLLSKACRNEPFTPSELSIGNMDRKGVIPLTDDSTHEAEPRCDSQEPIAEGARETLRSSPITYRPIWAYFSFSGASLSHLKSLATGGTPRSTFVSTDDVLSAFIWQSITRVRLARLDLSSSPISTLSRNVDMRRYMSLPLTYPGFVTGSTVNTHSVEDLVKQPLGIIAGWLRSALDAESLVRNFRSQIAAKVGKGGNAAAAGSAVVSDPELDVRLSSWAKEKCYEFDFGIGSKVGGGKADVVRRPSFADGAREGLVYFLPKTRDGEIMVGVCLRERDLDRLRGDEEFGRFGIYVG